MNTSDLYYSIARHHTTDISHRLHCAAK